MPIADPGRLVALFSHQRAGYVGRDISISLTLSEIAFNVTESFSLVLTLLRIVHSIFTPHLSYRTLAQKKY